MNAIYARMERFRPYILSLLRTDAPMSVKN